MAQKDISEKMLEDYNDVFCDIVNVFLFNGKRLMKEDELENVKAKSQLKLSNVIHEQERDVVKRWLKNDVRIALVGIENQTAVDKTMPIRIMSYDGASYKEQLAEIDKCLRNKKKPPELVPVVTFVIYFGAESWKKTRLYEVMEIPEYLRDYVSDYKINVFDIKDLTREQVEMFQSDFRIVADYFYKKYHCEDYVPDNATLHHVDEVLKLMSVLTGDDRYEQAVQEISDEERKGVRMCEVLDKLISQGEARGEARGKMRGLLGLVKKKYDKNMKPDEIADVLEENVELIRKIYDVIKEQGEGYTEDAALEKILK